MNENGTSARLWSRAIQIVLSFCLILLSGCDSGSSTVGEDFVFTGSSGAPQAATGAVTFNFIKAQAPLTVPLDTVRLRFRFYNGADGTGTLLMEELRDFAPTITIENVPGTVQSVVITAILADGTPVLQAGAPVAVAPGGETVVNFTSGSISPITQTDFILTPSVGFAAPNTNIQFTASLVYSNGEILPADNVTYSATGQATIDAGTGLATTGNDGVATVVATRGTDTAEVNLVVGSGPVLTTLLVTPDDVTVGLGSQLQFNVTGFDQNSDPFSLNSSNVVWSATNVSVNSGTGLVTADALGPATITATVGTVSGSTPLTVVASIPSIAFADTSNLLFTIDQTPSIQAPPNATVMDDQANLLGGALTFSLVGGPVTDAVFHVPASPAIGTVVGNNSSSVSVLLDANATPANIEAVIEATTLSFGTEFGNGTFQVLLSDGTGNTSVPVVRTFTIADPTPVVDLVETSLLSADVANGAVTFANMATVVDDLDFSGGGTMSFSLTGGASDARFFIPSTTIGTRSNNNSSTASVTFNGTVTTAGVQSLLRTVTIRGVTQGTATINVNLTDGDGYSATTVTRPYEFLPLNLTVYDGAPGAPSRDFPTIVSAVSFVRDTTGASGATITVLDSTLYTGGPETVIIENDNDLDNLRLIGSGQGLSAGVNPAVRTNVSRLGFTGIQAQNVTVDGFDFVASGNPTVNVLSTGQGASILNCRLDERGNAGAFQGIVSSATGTTVQNCLIAGHPVDGVEANASSDLVVTGCAFYGSPLYIPNAVGNETIMGNGHTGTGSGVDYLIVDTGTLVVSGSAFEENTDGNATDNGQVVANGTATIEAANNWWGQNADPSSPENFSGTGTVNFTPRLNADPFSSFP